MKCLLCNLEFENKKKLAWHVRRIHGISAFDYREQFGLNLYCRGCGSPINRRYNMTGFCNHCRDRNGANNSFFGKTHSNEMREHLSKTSSVSSKNLWATKEYRDKVIQNITGKKRSSQFKLDQSARITKWYKENPEQQKLRSVHMKRSWDDGKIEPNINSINESKIEKELRSTLQDSLIGRKVEKKTIKIDGKWFHPDILIDDNIIVEFYGDYWHANPNKFEDNDVVHHSFTAEEIRNNDKERVTILLENGYDVFIVWQSEYTTDKNRCVKELLRKINENKSFA